MMAMESQAGSSVGSSRGFSVMDLGSPGDIVRGAGGAEAGKGN